MRGFLCAALGLVLALLPCFQAAGEPVYLRVIARGDSRLAQAEKLRVRDAVRCALPADGTDVSTALPRIALAARRAGNARVTLRCWQPPGERAGLTVYVELGPATGHNWWGVLYPEALKLCAIEEPSAKPVADETDAPVVFSWPILRWLAGLLGWKATGL